MDKGFFSGLSSWLILACRQETSANISLPLFLLLVKHFFVNKKHFWFIPHVVIFV